MSRVIRRSSGRSSSEVPDLLQSLFASEFLAPSRTIWLVSPWISDVEILDNRTEEFNAIGDWGPRKVRFSEVLDGLLRLGVFVVVATTKAKSNAEFLRNLQRRAESSGRADSLQLFTSDEELHEKALTTDNFLIFGSMNFTYNGIFIRGELIEFTTDPQRVNEARLENHDRFGGVL